MYLRGMSIQASNVYSISLALHTRCVHIGSGFRVSFTVTVRVRFRLRVKAYAQR